MKVALWVLAGIPLLGTGISLLRPAHVRDPASLRVLERAA
jgi:hypothetical protein